MITELLASCDCAGLAGLSFSAIANGTALYMIFMYSVGVP